MNQRGRPTLYRPEYPDLARRLCLLGGTNENRRRRHWLERAQPPRATDVTAASFSSARYRRLIGSSREKLSAIFVSHFWGPVQTEARARLLTAVP
jgi:hypothetical protein